MANPLGLIFEDAVESSKAGIGNHRPDWITARIFSSHLSLNLHGFRTPARTDRYGGFSSAKNALN
ncbi:MAG: hypothetical protein HKN85_03610 [Gammaproteobacteria bacterium]|nr:hypothetical protein [Gammaproteobacteria bacterium]